MDGTGVSGKPGFESFLDDAERIPADARMECGICWWVYDPDAGDPQGQVPAGTAFRDLPGHWHCPNCDAEKTQFMVAAHGCDD